MLWISNVLVLTFQALAQVSSLNTPCLDTILSLPCLRLYNGATSYVRELSLLAHSFSHFLSCHTQAHHRLSKYTIQCWESELVRIRYIWWQRRFQLDGGSKSRRWRRKRKKIQLRSILERKIIWTRTTIARAHEETANRTSRKGRSDDKPEAASIQR